MQCKEFSSILEQEGLSTLPLTAQDHLAACDHCQIYFADLSSIVGCANRLPAEVDPPQRIWVSLRAQLVSEGLIHEPAVLLPESSSDWLRNLRAWFTLRSLATAGVGLTLAVAAFLQLHKHTTPIAHSVPVAQAPVQPKVQEPITQLAQQSVRQQVPLQAQVHPTGQQPRTQHLVAHLQPATPVLSTAPSEDLYRATPAGTIDDNSQGDDVADNPAVEAALRKNLRTVNELLRSAKSI